VAPGLTRAHRLSVGVPLGLLLLVGLSAPNAAQPDLAPPGWVIAPRLPLELGPAAVTATLWTAYLLGGLAVFLGLRGRVEALHTWLAPGLIALAALLSAWKAGDTNAFTDMLAGFESKAPAAYRLLIADRNVLYGEWIAQRLGQPGTVFVAVGSGHLAGKDSVQNWLSARGIEARRIA
jgi:hypothetical protein